MAGVGGVPEFDQRGTPFGRVFGGRIDIGAFEYQAASDLNLVVDTLADESDGNYALGDLSLREAILLANTYPSIDTIRFAPAHCGRPARFCLTMGELAITDSTSIIGLGANLLTIDASGNDPTPDSTYDDGISTNDGDGSRVFNIDDGIAARLQRCFHQRPDAHRRRLRGWPAGRSLPARISPIADSIITGNSDQRRAALRGGGGIYSFSRPSRFVQFADGSQQLRSPATMQRFIEGRRHSQTTSAAS